MNVLDKSHYVLLGVECPFQALHPSYSKDSETNYST